jgi:cell division protein ZapA (FtsZ GTPase activity inhibitor)
MKGGHTMAQTRQINAKPITAAQIKRIHTIKSILGISEDNYRAALDSRFGVTTSKDLTLMQAKNFLDELEKLALQVRDDRHQAERNTARQKAEAEHQKVEAAKPKRFDNLDNRPGMASGAQLRKIEAMWQDISIVPDQDARGRALRHFIKRIAGVADMRFLDSQMAGKVINALKAMEKQATAPSKAKNPKNAI